MHGFKCSGNNPDVFESQPGFTQRASGERYSGTLKRGIITSQLHSVSVFSEVVMYTMAGSSQLRTEVNIVGQRGRGGSENSGIRRGKVLSSP
jgi:hypothetical protein